MSYTTYGTTTFLVEPVEAVRIANVVVEDDTLVIGLTDGRALHLNMKYYPWLSWLQRATTEQRCLWEIVPAGGGVWWSDLDNGVELQPLLDMQPLLSIEQHRIIEGEL